MTEQQTDEQILIDANDSAYSSVFSRLDQQDNRIRDNTDFTHFDDYCARHGKEIIQAAALRLSGAGNGQMLIGIVVRELELMVDERAQPVGRETIPEKNSKNTPFKLIWHPVAERVFSRAENKAGWLLGVPLPPAPGVNWTRVAEARVAFSEALRRDTRTAISRTRRDIQESLQLISNTILNVTIHHDSMLSADIRPGRLKNVLQALEKNESVTINGFRRRFGINLSKMKFEVRVSKYEKRMEILRILSRIS